MSEIRVSAEKLDYSWYHLTQCMPAGGKEFVVCNAAVNATAIIACSGDYAVTGSALLRIIVPRIGVSDTQYLYYFLACHIASFYSFKLLVEFKL